MHMFLTCSSLLSLASVLTFTASTASAAEGPITEFALAGEGHRPQAIVTGPDGNLWVTEVGKHKIIRITPAGKITEFPVPGEKVGVLQGITAGADGNIWFSSREENAIRRVSLEGGIQRHLPHPVDGGNEKPPHHGVVAAGDGDRTRRKRLVRRDAREQDRPDHPEGGDHRIPGADRGQRSLCRGLRQEQDGLVHREPGPTRWRDWTLRRGRSMSSS